MDSLLSVVSFSGVLVFLLHTLRLLAGDFPSNHWKRQLILVISFVYLESVVSQITRFSFPLFRIIHYHSLLTKVSHGKRKMIGKRKTSAGLRRILSCSHRPRLWSKLPGFQNWFRLRWNVSALMKQLLSRKPVLQVVSHVTETSPVLKGTQVHA